MSERESVSPRRSGRFDQDAVVLARRAVQNGELVAEQAVVGGGQRHFRVLSIDPLGVKGGDDIRHAHGCALVRRRDARRGWNAPAEVERRWSIRLPWDTPL